MFKNRLELSSTQLISFDHLRNMNGIVGRYMEFTKYMTPDPRTDEPRIHIFRGQIAEISWWEHHPRQIYLEYCNKWQSSKRNWELVKSGLEPSLNFDQENEVVESLVGPFTCWGGTIFFMRQGAKKINAAIFARGQNMPKRPYCEKIYAKILEETFGV